MSARALNSIYQKAVSETFFTVKEQWAHSQQAQKDPGELKRLWLKKGIFEKGKVYSELETRVKDCVIKDWNYVDGSLWLIWYTTTKKCTLKHLFKTLT